MDGEANNATHNGNSYQRGARLRAVVTIGVFDGLHRGHCELLARVREKAAEENATPAAVTFDPPPQALLAPVRRPFEITPWPEKRRLLTEAGMERILLIRFTQATAALDPAVFIEDVVMGEFDPVGLVVGYDFRFGKGGRGDIDLLRRLGVEHGFWVERVDAVCLEERVISSTRVREAIVAGDMVEAAKLLGRPFSIAGEVIRGAGLGHRELVATANVAAGEEQLMPLSGVYVVTVLVDARPYAGVAMLGGSPSLGTLSDRLMEVHLLDFQGDLVGRPLEIRFLERLRDGRRYERIEDLRAAIEGDIHLARQKLGAGAAGPWAKAAKSACHPTRRVLPWEGSNR